MKYELESCIGSRVRVISRKIDNVYRKHLDDSGVTENQLSILMALYKTGLTEQKQIGQYLSLEKSSLSRNLQRLIAAQYIKKSGLINRPTIELTEKGKDKVDALTALWELAMDEIHDLLDDADLNGFQQFESRMNQL